MKNRRERLSNWIRVSALTLVMVLAASGETLTVEASTINEIKNQINNTQNKLNEINSNIDEWTQAQELAQEKIEDLNAEIINTMTSIGMKEDEIADKEEEIVQKKSDIEKTQKEYEAAKEKEEKQYQDMCIRIKAMYENGNTTFLNLLIKGNGFGDVLNQLDYAEMVYEYDYEMLLEYEKTKVEVHDLWERLEEEKKQLEADKEQLEQDKADLQEQKAVLDAMLAKKKQESDNYEAEIKKAKQEASIAKKLLQQEQQELKKLQQQQSKPSGGGGNAANGNYTETSYTETIENASGSELGKKVAKYACQFIGNPYVAGGTSLTNGADCSGFTYRVYKDFGYHLPRTSYQQRSAGTEVSYSEAEPGDLICYDGHVALYIGGGKIVHASTVKTGIKVGNATYREILSVRRIV